MTQKLNYETPLVEVVGSFEALTQGTAFGTRFDGTFVAGQDAPLDPDGRPLVLS